tara:strand:- start:268 stop:450 length:183 start_codon:yes stop_codon:yes gene_type:complete
MTAFLLILTFVLVASIVLWGGWVYEQSYIYENIPETELERKCKSLKRRIQEADFKFGKYS